jgi:hypothetical protein
MTLTALEIFQQAAERGLRLKAVGNDLHVNPGGCCSSDFVPVLQAHKPALLALLRLPFLMVFSETLGQSIFFCENEDTRVGLIEAGADTWSIYTRADLQVLVSHNRAKPFIPDELLRLHAAKHTFNARIVE